MSNLISGKEAWIAFFDNKEVQYSHTDSWYSLNNDFSVCDFQNDRVKFRIKPKTIMLGNIEVPAPFDPRIGDEYYHLSNESTQGYGYDEYECSDYDDRAMNFGAWRTEEEVKQVVEALRSIFK